VTPIEAAEKLDHPTDDRTLVDVSPERRRLLEECQTKLPYEFANPNLLLAALTHASSAGSRVSSNERLEFLGDAILGMVVCERLFASYPDLLEGELTKIKSVVVSRNTCARLAAQMGMQKYLILGKGMAAQGSIPRSVLADCFEALIAAIHLDGGLQAAREFVMRHVQPEIDAAAGAREVGNYKSQLQQLIQKDRAATPTYVTVEEKGPDHSKLFLVAAVIGGERYPAAWGRNKKEAEQRAALNALCRIEDRPTPFDERHPVA
jgi:ribonuclease-3